MISSRSAEIRLWWTMPLAAAIWLIIIWGFGFFLKTPEVEGTTPPPPIHASFIELPDPKQEEKLSPPPSTGSQAQPQIKPKASKPEQKAPPPSRQSTQAKAPVKPKATEPAKPVRSLPEKEYIRPDTPEPPQDLSDYINQAKARRGEAGIFDERQNSEARPPSQQQLSREEIRAANIKRNLQTPGTSGIFQINRMGPRTAEFTFRAWTTGINNSRLETIEVDAGPNGNVERAIIRRMIQLIRQYHKGNFNWESHRLHRVIVLSARLEDNAGLEEFLMREFFGDQIPAHMR